MKPSTNMFVGFCVLDLEFFITAYTRVNSFKRVAEGLDLLIARWFRYKLVQDDKPEARD